jgi:glycosyltransferase involved in cell wall biosynthesis
MDNNPLITVIIPSFNQGQFIRETIDSILNQPFKKIEVIVIDGGSTDTTVDILKTYGNRIYWISEKDRGQTHAINKGLHLAKGDIIAYLNSDDYYLPNTLQQIAELFKTHPDIFWITGDYNIVDETGKGIQSFVISYKKIARKFLSFNLLSILNPIAQPSTFLRRKLIEDVGLFKEELRYTMDYDYWLRAIQLKKPFLLNEKLSAFRIHGSSKGGSQYHKQFEEELKVAKNYQKNKLLILLHQLHNLLIVTVYKIIK